MCTVLLAPGVNLIAVNKYININKTLLRITLHVLMQVIRGVGEIKSCLFWWRQNYCNKHRQHILVFYSKKSRMYTTKREQTLHSLFSPHTDNSSKPSQPLYPRSCPQNVTPETIRVITSAILPSQVNSSKPLQQPFCPQTVISCKQPQPILPPSCPRKLTAANHHSHYIHRPSLKS